MQNSNSESKELVERLQNFPELKRLDEKCIFCLEELSREDNIKIKNLGRAHDGCFKLYGEDARYANSFLRNNCLKEFHRYFDVCRNMSKEGIQVLGEACYDLN